MSDALPPLADITLDAAMGMRGDLMRAIASGAMSLRYSDGTMVTYANMDEKLRALARLDSWISDAVAVSLNTTATDPVRAVRFIPSSGYR